MGYFSLGRGPLVTNGITSGVDSEPSTSMVASKKRKRSDVHQDNEEEMSKQASEEEINKKMIAVIAEL